MGWIIGVILTALAAIPVGISALAVFGELGGSSQGASQSGGSVNYRGAPAPIAGVGLPLLTIIGGSYWAYRRRRGRD